MPNVFDQFDQKPQGNAFDQFDAPSQKGPASSAPPSMLQTLVASPLGSLPHDLIVGPLNSALLSMAKKFTNEVRGVNPNSPYMKSSAGQALSDQSFDPLENSYRASLAAQQNRPGYADALQTAQGIAGKRPSGLTDQVIAPLAPAMAGLAGLATGGLNGMMAQADVQRSGQQAYQQQNPIKSTAAQLVGGLLATPEGAMSGIPDKIGTVLHPISPSALSPEEEAANYVKGLMASSKTAPNAAALDSFGANGKPITSAEAIGKPGEVALGALARREGGTADALAGEMAARQADAPNRILGDFSAASGIDPALAKGDIEGYVASGRQAVKPMFDQALSGDKAVWNADLARLSQRPVVQKAMENVAEDLRNADINPEALGFTGQDPVTGKFIQQPRPTPQAWDMVKKRLGQSVERDPFGKIIPDSVSPGNYNINGANRAVTAALRDAVPGYGDALDASGDYLSMQKSFNDGQAFILNPKVTAAQVQQHVAGLSQSEAQAFKGGIANKLFDLQQNGKLVAKLADAPSVQEKLAVTLGRDNASKFVQNLGLEKNMTNFARTRVPGAGSPTAEYAAAMAAQDAGTGISPDLINLAANAVQKGPVRAGIGYVAGKAKDAAATWATRGMSIPVRDAAGKLLLMHPTELSSILASRAAPLAAAPTVLSAPAITSASRIPYAMVPFGFSALANQQAQ